MTDQAGVDEAFADRTRVSVACGPLVGPVVTRVVGMLATRANLPLDRLNDAILIADAIAAHGPAFALDGRLSMSVLPADGHLEVRLGPLREGGATRLLEQAALPGLGNIIERLADSLRVQSTGAGGDYLTLAITAGP